MDPAGPAGWGDEAQRWVVRQCALGPRVPGTPAHAAWLRMIHAYLDSLGMPAQEERFRAFSPLGPDSLHLTNLRVAIRPGVRPRILLGAHWDSRPWADQDPDPQAHHHPIPGANDGASGVAVLLILARHLAANPPPVGVDLAFFDGEDLGDDAHPERFCLGSQWMAEHWSGPLPDWAVVLDMVGSSGMTLGKELYSANAAPQLQELIFQVASGKGYSEWNPDAQYAIIDDQLPFQKIGVRAVDLIGWGDPVWHTLKDDPSHTSPRSMGRVVDVVISLISSGYLGP